MSPRILTLTTDFGTEGPYVAALKGVILTSAPNTKLVDVSHRIAPQNILEGAFVIASVIDVFPPETVHLAVIDPGVGTDRKLVALRVAGQWVVGPDNGLLGGVARRQQTEGLWEITNPAIRRSVVSNTFHGRDILAPAAAFLLNGGAPDELGARGERVIELANFDPRTSGQEIIGEVIFRDAFGNLITNVREEHLTARSPTDWQVEISGAKVSGLVRTYADRPPGELVALVGSSGWVEVAVVNGDAARLLGALPGTTVWFNPLAER
jgi:S-adenosylmethionine hydrolase